MKRRRRSLAQFTERKLLYPLRSAAYIPGISGSFDFRTLALMDSLPRPEAVASVQNCHTGPTDYQPPIQKATYFSPHFSPSDGPKIFQRPFSAQVPREANTCCQGPGWGGAKGSGRGVATGVNVATCAPRPPIVMVRHQGLEPTDVTPCSNKHLQNPLAAGGAECGALPADSGPAAPVSAPPSLPPDVADLARRLTALPEAVRASLLAALNAAGPEKVDGRHE